MSKPVSQTISQPWLSRSQAGHHTLIAMGIHIWCLMAPIFLVSVNAGLHDIVSRSFYEPPQSSSPAPTQYPRPELIGMKEIVLFLTPDQVETLQAAGAVVQPYPEYETNFAEVQEQFRQRIEQQNEQQYQTWRNPIEDEKHNPELLNYHKLLNIQEINDDLAQHTQATEGTTEKITTITPRYKYTRTKLRQQYKDKEFSTPDTPKKESRIKISNENNNADYVRFLPNFENENLQIIPYQPLPLSPYQFNQEQANEFIQADKEAQPTAYTVANTEAQHKEYSQESIVGRKYIYSQVNKEAEKTAYTVANTEVHQNAHSQETIVPQQTTYIEVNKDTQQPAYTVASTETQQNAYNQVNVEAKSNAYIEANTEARQSAFSQVNKESQRNIFRPYVPFRSQIESPQAVVEVSVPRVTQRPMKVQTYRITQDTTEFKETLSSIEGLLPLPPLPNFHKEQQEKPETPASPAAPTTETSIANQDKFSILLAPLYQHQTIESINRQKAELLKNEFKIRAKLQQMKESQYYDNQEYTTEIEKLTRNFGQQNALAKIEATSISNSPSVFVNQESETTGSHPIEVVKSTEIPMVVRIPKPLDVKIPAPYPAPLEFMRSFLVPKPVEVGKRGPYKEMRNVYIKVDKPYTIQKVVPFTGNHRTSVRIPINDPEQLTIVRPIWEH